VDSGDRRIGYDSLAEEWMATVKVNSQVGVDEGRLASFCRRWEVAELALFGSALRADFGPESDVDFLVTFSPEADWSLLDHVTMESELSEIVGRKVDLVNRSAIERSDNWIRREAILRSAEPFFVAR
jgi:predicted nucleotidyltransferase